MDRLVQLGSPQHIFKYILWLLVAGFLFTNQCYAQTLNGDQGEQDARYLAQEHISDFLAELPMEGRVSWHGTYDEEKSYHGPSRKMGWWSRRIRVDPAASKVIVIEEIVYSGSYFGTPCVRRDLTTKCFNAKPPWNPLSSIRQYTETRGDEVPLKRIEELNYSGEMVSIRYEEAGEPRSVIIRAGKFSLVDELLPEILISLFPQSSLSAKVHEKPAEGMQYDHNITKIEPTDTGWEIVNTTPDGTLRYKAKAEKDGSILLWEYPDGEVDRREDEDTAMAGTGKYKFQETLEFSLASANLLPTWPINVEYAIPGDWTSLITSSDIQSVTFDADQMQTVVLIHPIDRKPIPEAPNDRTKYLINTPEIPKQIQAIASQITKDAQTETEKLHSILSWIYRRIRYQINYDPPSDLEVVKERKGDCSEFSKLMVLLCRSCGIPARDITGLYGHTSGKMGLHAWIEALIDGHWISADPTAGELYPDCGHIRLTYESRNDAKAASQCDLFLSERPVIQIQRSETGDDAWKSLYAQLANKNPSEALWLYKQNQIDSGGTKASLRLAETVVDIDPLFPKAWENLAYLYVAHHDDANAIRCFEKARELNPFEEYLTVEISSAFSRAGDQEKAISEISAAILKFPTSERLLNHRGVLYRDIGQHEESISDFRDAFRLSPQSGLNAFMVVQELLRVRQLDEALRFLQEAESTITEDKEYISYCKSQVFLRKGLYENAVKESLSAFEINTEDTSNVTIPADTIFAAGHESLGIDLLTSAIDMVPENPRLLLARSKLFRSQNDFEAAIKDLNVAIRIRPTDSAILDESIGVMTQMGLSEDAAVLFEKALEISDDKAAIHFGEACRHFDRHDFDLAESHLISALRENPYTSKYVIKQAEVIFNYGQTEAAIQLLDSASEDPSYDDIAAILHKAALLLERQGRLEDALAYYAKSSSAAPSQPGYVVDYAKTLNDLGRVDEAIQVLSDTLPQVINRDDLYFARGELFRSQKQFERAAEDFREACRHYPARSFYWTALAGVMADTGDVNAALEVISEASMIFTADAVIENARGLLFYGESRWSEAASAFRLAAEYDPRTSTYVENAVLVYLELKSFNEALTLIDAIIVATRETPELLALRGDVYFGAEEFESAEFEYKAAIAASYPDLNVDNLQVKLGKALWKQEKYVAADEAFDAAVEGKALESEIAIRIGNWLFEISEFDSALKHYQMAIERTPAIPQIWLNIAETQIKRQELGSAEDALTAAIARCSEKHALYSKRALVRELLDKWEDAKRDLHDSIPPNCDRADLLSAAAGTYAKRNDFEQALGFFNRTITLQPDNIEHYRDRLLCSIAADLELAEEYVRDTFRRAYISSRPIDLDQVAWNASVSTRHAFPWQSLRIVASKNVELQPENTDFLETLGAIEFRAGEYSSALKNLRKSLDLAGYDLSRLSDSRPEIDIERGSESQDEIGNHCYCLGFLALTLQASGDFIAAQKARVDFDLSHLRHPPTDWRDTLRRKMIKQQLDQYVSAEK